MLIQYLAAVLTQRKVHIESCTALDCRGLEVAE